MITLAALALVALSMDSPPAIPRRTTESINISLAPFGMYSLELEHALAPWLTAYAEAIVAHTDFSLAPAPFTLHGFALSLGARAFPLGEAPAGPFIGAQAGLLALDRHQQGAVSPSKTSVMIGMLGGWQFVFGRGVVVSPGLGVHVVIGGRSVIGDLPDGWGLGPLLRLNVGLAF